MLNAYKILGIYFISIGILGFALVQVGNVGGIPEWWTPNVYFILQVVLLPYVALHNVFNDISNAVHIEVPSDIPNTKTIIAPLSEMAAVMPMIILVLFGSLLFLRGRREE